MASELTKEVLLTDHERISLNSIARMVGRHHKGTVTLEEANNLQKLLYAYDTLLSRASEVERLREQLTGLQTLFVVCSESAPERTPLTLDAAEIECKRVLSRIAEIRAGKTVSHEEAMAAIGTCRDKVRAALAQQEPPHV